MAARCPSVGREATASRITLERSASVSGKPVLLATAARSTGSAILRSSFQGSSSFSPAMFQACRCSASNAPRSTGPDANPGWPWARARKSDSCHSGFGDFSPASMHKAIREAWMPSEVRKQSRHPPTGEPGACTAQLRFKGKEVATELCRRPGTEFPKNAQRSAPPGPGPAQGTHGDRGIGQAEPRCARPRSDRSSQAPR